MFVVTNNIKVKKGHGLEVAERFRQSKGITEFEGFVKMEVLLSTGYEEHDELAIRTTWESEDNFVSWTNSESFRSAHAHGKPGQSRPTPGMMLGSYLTKQELVFTNERKSEEV
ncbi:MAG: antibiotic biosynthesis monooxygenase [Bacillaceae bacterium]